MKTFLSSKLALALVGAVLVAAIGVVTAVVLGSDAPRSREDVRAASRGWTDTVTVPLYSADQYRPSVPRPAQLPPMIRAEGPCKSAMDAIRTFQEDNPSGLSLSAAASSKLAALLRTLGPGDPAAACSDTLAQRFRLQELDPWLTWQPTPAAAPSRQSQAPSKSMPGRSGRASTEAVPTPDGDIAPTDPSGAPRRGGQ